MADENLVKISDLPLGHRTDLEGSFVPVALPNQQTYKVPLEEFMDPLEIMVAVYGTTSMEAVTVALSAGKTILAARQVSSVTRLAPLTDHATGAYHFVWQNSDGTRELWELTSSGWTEETITLASGVTTTVSEITENTTVTLVAGQNRYLTCTNTPAILVEIANNNAYHLQINGSCTIALTGVSWIGDEITAVAAKAEISILNNVAVGVLYE